MENIELVIIICIIGMCILGFIFPLILIFSEIISYSIKYFRKRRIEYHYNFYCPECMLKNDKFVGKYPESEEYRYAKLTNKITMDL